MLTTCPDPIHVHSSELSGNNIHKAWGTLFRHEKQVVKEILQTVTIVIVWKP